ncbi:MAG: hypothetical protein LC121_22355 [Anaerolineae bacterium]|nr:hypothetical protein [Anaerolineae bacterium]
MSNQVQIDPAAPTTIGKRVLDIVRQPFMTPPQPYELAESSTILNMQFDQYMRSPISGVQYGIIGGGVLTLLAFWGLVVNAVPRLRLQKSWALAIGLCLVRVNIGLFAQSATLAYFREIPVKLFRRNCFWGLITLLRRTLCAPPCVID